MRHLRRSKVFVDFFDNGLIFVFRYFAISVLHYVFRKEVRLLENYLQNFSYQQLLIDLKIIQRFGVIFIVIYFMFMVPCIIIYSMK